MKYKMQLKQTWLFSLVSNKKNQNTISYRRNTLYKKIIKPYETFRQLKEELTMDQLETVTKRGGGVGSYALVA